MICSRLDKVISEMAGRKFYIHTFGRVETRRHPIKEWISSEYSGKAYLI